MRNDTIGLLVRGLVLAGLAAAATSAVFAQAPANRTSAPPAVLKAFRQTYPGAAISATSQERRGDRTVIRVESVDKGRRRVVLYDPASTVIEVAEQVEERELPPPVAAAMRSHPRAIYGGGLKITRGKSVVEYHLTLRGTRKTAMIARPDGTVVSFK